MKIILLVVASLFIAAVVAFVSGCASTYSNLAARHEPLLEPRNPDVDETPESADMAVRRARVMSVSAACAYDVLADIDAWPSWDESIVRTERLEGTSTRAGALFHQQIGDYRFNARILDAEPGKRLRWRGQNPDGSGIVGVHTWTFVDQPDGTTLVINDEHFHSWYVRPLGWFTDLGIAKQFDKTLENLEAEAKRRCHEGA